MMYATFYRQGNSTQQIEIHIGDTLQNIELLLVKSDRLVVQADGDELECALRIVTNNRTTTPIKRVMRFVGDEAAKILLNW